MISKWYYTFTRNAFHKGKQTKLSGKMNLMVISTFDMVNQIDVES